MKNEVPEGVEAFNFWTLWVMGSLWERFPMPTEINPEADIAAHIERLKQEGTEIGLDDFPRVALLSATINWLLTEGYIAGGLYRPLGVGVYADMILTEKGLKSLSKVPSAIEGKNIPTPKPLGTLMREAAVSQAFGVGAFLVEAMFKR
jgi:hypothetical protein